MSRFKQARVHVYSLVALTLVAANFAVSYVFMSRGYLGPALTPYSPQVQRLGWTYVVLDGLALLFSALAIWREHRHRLAYIALWASLVASVLCGMRFPE